MVGSLCPQGFPHAFGRAFPLSSLIVALAVPVEASCGHPILGIKTFPLYRFSNYPSFMLLHVRPLA